MKNLFLIASFFVFTAATAQTTNLSTKRMQVIDSFYLNGKWVTGVATAAATDSTPKKIPNVDWVMQWVASHAVEGMAIDTANKWIRTLTKNASGDSLVFFIGGNRYAIKDSSTDATKVPLSRSITINGTTYDLNADRTWTVTGTDATKVPLSRSITINGTTYDLNADRSWTVTGTDATKVPLTRSITINGTTYDLNADRSWTVTGTDATKVPLVRTITINGVAYDLNADRSWTISPTDTSHLSTRIDAKLNSSDVFTRTAKDSSDNAGTTKYTDQAVQAAKQDIIANHGLKILADKKYFTVVGDTSLHLNVDSLPVVGGYNNYIPVSTFGVSRDSTAARNAVHITAAIAAAAAAKKAVFIDGNYITNTITIYQNNITFFGLDSASSGLSLPSGVSTGTDLLVITGNGFSIRDMSLNCNHANLTAPVVTRAIYLTGNNFASNHVFFKNAEYGIRAIGTGTSSTGLDVTYCHADSIGNTFLNPTDFSNINVVNNIVYGFAVNDATARCFGYTATTGGGIKNLFQSGNIVYNSYGCTNFVTESPGSERNMQNVQIRNERYNAGGYPCGGISVGMDSAVIDNFIFLNGAPYSYAIESSTGHDLTVNGGTLSGLIRLGMHLSDTAFNIKIIGTTLNPISGGINYDNIIAIGGHDHSGGTTGVVQGLTIRDVTVNAKSAKAYSGMVLGNYGGGKVVLNDVLVDNYTYYGNPSMTPVGIYLTGNGGNRINIRNSHLYGIGNGLFTDGGIYYGLRVENNLCPGTFIHSSITSATAPNFVSLNNTSDTTLPAQVKIGNTSITPYPGTPEAHLTAPVGSMVLDITTGTIYTKQTGTGNAGWVAVSAGSSAWGGIGGTLSSQTDLQTALNNKAPNNNASLTGNVLVPTQPITDTTTKAANGLYVARYIKGLNLATLSALNDSAAALSARIAAGGLTVDATVVDGSTNPVQGNGVFDALAAKATITALADSSAKKQSTDSTQVADYFITKRGSTYYALPKAGSGNKMFSNADAAIAIDSALGVINPAGRAQGTGGGWIDIGTGTFNLTGEIVIIGGETSNPPFSKIKITGHGFSTRIIQNTSGKNAFVIKNRACADILDMWIGVGSSALSGILMDDNGANSEISLFKGRVDGVMIISSGSAPAFYAKNFFALQVPWLWAENTGGDGVRLANTTTGVTNYGNAEFGIINAKGKSTWPFADFAIISDVANHPMNLMHINSLYVGTGYYGVYLRGAASNTFSAIDIEHPTKNGVYMADGASGVENYNNTFLAGLILGNSGDTLIYCSQKSAGNTFANNLRLEGDGAAIVKDLQQFRQANSFSFGFGYAYGATPTLQIASPSETPVIYTKAFDQLTVRLGPLAGVTSVGTFSGTSDAKGATISGTSIIMHKGDGTNPGLTKVYTSTGSSTDGTMDRNSITNALAAKASLTGTETLTNKTLTSPNLNATSVIGQAWTATSTAGAGAWTTIPLDSTKLLGTKRFADSAKIWRDSINALRTTIASLSPAFESGTYTPTVTAGGVTPTAHVAHYMRVGNEVTVDGSFDIASTGTGAVFYMYVSLVPGLSATFTDPLQLTGIFTENSSAINSGAIDGDTIGNQAVMNGVTTVATNRTFYYRFTYTLTLD